MIYLKQVRAYSGRYTSMAYPIELLFDDEASEAVRKLWNDLSVTGISSHMLNSGQHFYRRMHGDRFLSSE